MFMWKVDWAARMATTIARLPNSTTFIDMSRSVRGTAVPVPARVLAPLAARSRSPERTELTIIGMARNMLMMPPVATAPAPMYST